MELKDTLFLPSTPGSHSQVEALWHSDLATVDWWSPAKLCGTSTCTYTQLMDQVSRKLERMVLGNSPSKIKLIGHSFGCYLALDALDMHSPLIESVTLLAPSRGPFSSAENLGASLVADGEVALDGPLNEFRVKQDGESFWALLQAFTQCSRLKGRLWGPHSEYFRIQHGQLVAQCSALDKEDFFWILDDFLFHDWELVLKGLDPGKIKVFLGNADPLCRIREDVDFWRANHVEVEILNSGHYIQFERPSREWMPS